MGGGAEVAGTSLRGRTTTREEEWQQREEHNRRQMEVLQSLVVGIQLQGEVANRRAEREKDAKIAKLTEEDNIVAYLTMFERIMTAL